MSKKHASLTNTRCHTAEPSLDFDLAKSHLVLHKEKLMKEASLQYTEGNKLIVYDSDAEIIYDSRDDCFSTQPKKERRLLMRQLLLQRKEIWEKRRMKVENELTFEELKELDRARARFPQKLIPHYTPKTRLLLPKKTPLLFSSHFECGNLRRAVLTADDEYELQLHPDSGARSYSQWFYFCVRNRRKGKVRLSVRNMRKSRASFVDGMLPAVWSKARQQREGVKWHSAGEDVTYHKAKESETDPEFILSFSYTFQYENDCVYFAHSIPYSYSKLEGFLKKIESKANLKHIVAVKTLCHTFVLNKCPYLVITENKREKPSIVVTGRVHPGESNSSYVIEGFINFLLSSDSRAKKLRSSFVFYVIPMLNPDGVIFGNYRCSVTGADLNRNWISPSKILQPTIYFTKRLIQELSQKQQPLASFCDFHGHSSNRNVFLLGCQSALNDCECQEKNRRIKLFARVLSKLSPHFSFAGSKFGVEKNKLSTGRVVIYKEFGVLQSYTLESSMHGSDFLATEAASKNSKSLAHFSLQDLSNIGKTVALAYFTQSVLIQREGLPDRKQIEEFIENFNRAKKVSQYSKIHIKTLNHARNERQLVSVEPEEQRTCHNEYKGSSRNARENCKVESSLPSIGKQTSVATVLHAPLAKFAYTESKQDDYKRSYKPLKQSARIAFDRLAADRRYLRPRNVELGTSHKKNFQVSTSLEKHAKAFHSAQSQTRYKNCTLRSRKGCKQLDALNAVQSSAAVQEEGMYRSMNMQLKVRKRKFNWEPDEAKKGIYCSLCQ